MTTKTKVIISIAVVLTAFAFGRYTTPTKTVTITKTVEVEKKTQDITEKQHEKTVITETPDGTKTTVITQDTNTNTKEKDDSSTTTDTTKTVVRGGSRVSLSFLAGVPVTNLASPVYGGYVSKEILGPITVGAFGLSSGVAGLSIGLNF